MPQIPLPALAVPHVTALYAALLAFVFLVLSFLVIRQRHRTKSLLGAEHPDLFRAVRAHANFAEYVPLGLILLGLLELGGTRHWLLHALGLALLAGRISHAYALIADEPKSQANGSLRLYFRPAGMALTFGSLGIAALVLLTQAG